MECAQIYSETNTELPVFDAKFSPNGLPLDALDEPIDAVAVFVPRSMNLDMIGRLHLLNIFCTIP